MKEVNQIRNSSLMISALGRQKGFSTSQIAAVAVAGAAVGGGIAIF
jgi:hypothetical protein